MVTRGKNKSAHPGIPDMSPAQLLAAGLSHASSTPRRPKQPTKAQEIAALKEELRSIKELVALNRSDQESLEAGGDTEPATDTEEAVIVGTKRKAKGSIGSTAKLKRSRAINPFESSSVVHPRATGLFDDWRLRMQSPHGTTPLQSMSPLSAATSTSPASVLSRNSFNFEENLLPTFALPKNNGKGPRVYPGIKDLPGHFQDFRNTFIRFVIRQVANSKSPWVNPDVDALQILYDLAYPAFPAQIRHNDAAFHPTISALGVLRNHLASAAITAVQRHLVTVFRKKKLDTIEARAKYIADLFKSKHDHPIIWREYSEGNIKNHPEIGGYKTTRRGVFQSDPILETLRVYYSSSGIMESSPLEDPGVGSRPIGVLALATTAVKRAYLMHETGDFILSGQQFNADDWDPSTVTFMGHIVKDLSEKQWNSIFISLATFSTRVLKEEATRNGASEESDEHVPLPPSDPPSPAHDD